MTVQHKNYGNSNSIYLFIESGLKEQRQKEMRNREKELLDFMKMIFTMDREPAF